MANGYIYSSQLGPSWSVAGSLNSACPGRAEATHLRPGHVAGGMNLLGSRGPGWEGRPLGPQPGSRLPQRPGLRALGVRVPRFRLGSSPETGRKGLHGAGLRSQAVAPGAETQWGWHHVCVCEALSISPRPPRVLNQRRLQLGPISHHSDVKNPSLFSLRTRAGFDSGSLQRF